MTAQFWVGLGCGWAGGLLFGRFVLRTIFDQLIRGTRMVSWIRKSLDARGAAVVIMSVAITVALFVGFQGRHNLHRVVECQRDYNTAQSTAANARADANAPTQKALREFLHALRPLLAARAKGEQPTPDQVTAVRLAYIAYDNAAGTLNRTLADTPLPPSPDTFCEGIG